MSKKIIVSKKRAKKYKNGITASFLLSLFDRGLLLLGWIRGSNPQNPFKQTIVKLNELVKKDVIDNG